MGKKQEKYTLINKITVVYIVNTVLYMLNIKIKNALHKLDTSVCISLKGITPTPVGVPFEVYSFNNIN